MPFVHAVVSEQVAFVTGEVLHIGCRYLFRREGFEPNACLEHVGCTVYTESERTGSIHYEVSRQLLIVVRRERYRLRTDIEAYGLMLVVIDGYDTAEYTGRQCAGSGSKETALLAAAEQHHQPAVGAVGERYGIVFGCRQGLEERTAFGFGRTNQYIECEGRVGERTADCRTCVRRLSFVEMQARTGGYTRGVGHTHDLEIVILVQVVAGYGFVEAQFEVRAYAEDGIGRLRCTKDARGTGIFRAADDRRSLGDEARTVAAEGYGTQVVLLLYRVALAVEAEGHNTAVLNHRLIAGGLLVERFIGIERTLVDPHILRLGGEFVLELDMVEVLMVDIKAADLYRQEIAG